MPLHAPSRHQGQLLRIERGAPQGYWEHNLLDGRRAAEAKIVEWFRDFGINAPSSEPRDARSVLDAGCGIASLGARLTAAGARVTLADLAIERLWEARGRASAPLDQTPRAASRCVLTDVTRSAFRTQNFDDAIVFEVLEHLTAEHRAALLRTVDQAVRARLFLVFRIASRWDRWRDALTPQMEEGLPMLDATAILRELHLATSFRLRRTAEVRRRNCALHCAELQRPAT
jgi:2-polyprenyl-3-methyl-5-hydroxy-6-metoxy-1,4-benzoquinol methylase